MLARLLSAADVNSLEAIPNRREEWGGSYITPPQNPKNTHMYTHTPHADTLLLIFLMPFFHVIKFPQILYVCLILRTQWSLEN